MPDGRIVSGVTDLNGSTSLNTSDVIDDMTITLIKGK
jgi:type VI secretion system secreted protein VgrG